MPTWTIRLVRAGLIYLALGFLAGAILLVEKTGWLDLGGRLQWLPLHVEVVLVGWFLQTTMGVAYWILPRYPTRPERGPAWPPAWAFSLLNLGIVLTVAGEIWPGLTHAPVAGRIMEVVAVALFGIHLWPRIRPAPAPIRQ